MSLHTTERDLRKAFGVYGEIESVSFSFPVPSIAVLTGHYGLQSCKNGVFRRSYCRFLPKYP